MAWSIVAKFLAAALLLDSLTTAVIAEECQSSPDTQRVTYVVVEMPEPLLSSTTAPTLPTDVPVGEAPNVTHTLWTSHWAGY
jgi:hypothetical protein